VEICRRARICSETTSSSRPQVGWRSPWGSGAWLEALTGRMTLERFDIRLIATRRYGDVGVVLAESSQEGAHDGAPYSMTFRYTDVWVLESDGWRLATRHASGTAAHWTTSWPADPEDHRVPPERARTHDEQGLVSRRAPIAKTIRSKAPETGPFQ
jgi:hypothetical protein